MNCPQCKPQGGQTGTHSKLGNTGCPTKKERTDTRWQRSPTLKRVQGNERVDYHEELESEIRSDSDDDGRQVVIDAFWKAWELRLNELCSSVEACAGAAELVEGLRALHIPMAIATSSRMDSVSKKKLR